MDELRHQIRALHAELERTSAEGWDSLIAARSRSIVVALEDGRITRTSAMVEEMFGYVPGELTGKSVHDLVPEALRAVHERHVRGFADEPRARLMGTGTMALRGRKRDGTEIPLAIELFPVAKDGRLYVVAAIMPVRSTP